MKPSITYRILRKLGLNFSEEEYGQVSLFEVLKKTLQRVKNAFLLEHCLHIFFLTPINSRYLRPKIWRWFGIKVGKDVYIGYQVLPDTSNPTMIEIEDKVHIANRCILLCHQRDLSEYYIDSDYSKLPYKRGKIHLKKGCLIGTNSIVMPGVTVGEGAIIGAYSLITKDIPSWSIAVGRPAKVIKEIRENPERIGKSEKK